MPDKSQLVREVFAELSKPGASVWLTHMLNARDVVRLGVETYVLEYRSPSGQRLPFGISPEQWLSVEPCREPRRWSGEATVHPSGACAWIEIHKDTPMNTRVHYELTEILEEK